MTPQQAECPTCGGTGFLYRAEPVSHIHMNASLCPTCHGTGKVPTTAPIEAQEAKYVEKESKWCNRCRHDHAMGIGYDHKPVNDPKCKCGHSYVAHWHGPLTAECSESPCDCKRYSPHPEATQGDELDAILKCSCGIELFDGSHYDDCPKAAKKAIQAYLTTTATRMAVEARVDTLKPYASQFKARLTSPDQDGYEFYWGTRLLTEYEKLQAQLKNGDKS